MALPPQIWTLHVGPPDSPETSEQAGCGWRLACAQAGQVVWVDLPQQADAAASAVMAAMDLGRDRLVVAVASAWCYGVSVDNPPVRRGWRELVRNELEEHLPLVAEEMVIDALPGAERSYVVAARLAQLQEVLDHLNAAAMPRRAPIVAICPAVFLALDALPDVHGADRGESQPGEDRLLLLANHEHVDVVVLAQGNVAAWHWVGADAQRMAERLDVTLRGDGAEPADSGRPVLALGLAAEVVEPIVSAWGGQQVACEAGAESVDALATLAVSQMGRSRPKLNLLRPPLGQAAGSSGRAWWAAGVAAMMFLAALNGAWLWRASQYDRQVQTLVQEQTALFQELHPNARRVPGDIHGRLQSDYHALADHSGLTDPNQRGASLGLTPHLSALELWVELFNSLPSASAGPPGVRYQLTRANLTGQSLRLEGLARSYQDAGTLSQTLEQSKRLMFEPARTSVEGDGQVRFQIVGKPASPWSRLPGPGEAR